ncbi:MAG TPA: MATE family efflux transporter [Burkholderiales bacterium]|nr:MATE family efflux transporter [Burkholderiales bacterium]
MSNGNASTPALGQAVAPARPASARTKILLEGSILPTLLRLSAPNVLNLAAIAGLITFDGLFLGRLGADALAGVSLVFPFVMFIQHAAASGMGGAVSSAVARALGAGARERANDFAMHAVALALGMAVVFSGVMLWIGPLIFRWMGGRGAVLQAALDYSTVVLGGAISICVLNILANVVRGTGNMAYPAGVLVASVVAHVVISPILIFGWGPVPPLGPAGAGWGIVVPFGIGSAVLFCRLRSGNTLVRLDFSRMPRQWTLYKEFFRVGIPGMMNVAINNLTVIVLTGVAGHLGREAAIGYAMGARLEYIMIPLAFGFGTALVAMVGTNWGARQRQRARTIGWLGGGAVAASCGVVGLFFAFFPSVWMRLFTDEQAVIQVGTLYLQTVGPIYAMYGLGMAIYFAMQGVGNVVPAVVANGLRLLASAGGALAAVWWIDAGPLGVFIAIACGFILYGILNAYLLARR